MENLLFCNICFKSFNAEENAPTVAIETEKDGEGKKSIKKVQ